MYTCLTLCLLGSFSCFLSSAFFLQNHFFSKNSLRNTIRVSNSLDPDQARHFVGPDLGQNCLQRLSADDTRRWRVKGFRKEQSDMITDSCDITENLLRVMFTHCSPVTTFVVCSSHLLMFLGCLYCKQYRPRSDCSIGSSIIRVHFVCFHETIWSQMHLNTCSRRKKQTTFSGQN